MAEFVVDLFKVIQVNQKKCHFGSVSIGRGPGHIERVLQMAAVRQPGERIAKCCLFQLLFSCLQFSRPFPNGINVGLG
jgi:hypothetical protein